MRLTSRSGLIATILAIGAIAAPTAQAGGLMSATASDPPGAAQQEAQSFLRIYSHQASTPTRVVVSNPDEQLPASTPAVATPDKATIARDQLGDQQLSAALLRIAQVNGRNIPSTTTTAVRTGNGFQYDDAAVGAGVMVAVLALAGTAVLTLRRRGHLRLG
jgi:hypothetical protein